VAGSRATTRRLAAVFGSLECQIKGPRCTFVATQVDHVIPVEAGGARYDPANLRASCEWDNKHREHQGRKQRKPRPARAWPKLKVPGGRSGGPGDGDHGVVIA
jgi:5-methylcytosine-specific restriction endonuclease McrA